MMTMKRFALAVVFLMCAMIPALAQGGPPQTKIHFTTNTEFELKKGSGVMLPPGNYILFRFETNNRNLFALYQDDMTHRPIAMIETAPVLYTLGWRPGHTNILMEQDESAQNTPVLEGWNVPGEDGWQVITTITGGKALRSRIKARR